MTAEEFKKLKPEYKDVEGDQLWDAMTDYVLRQQAGSETMKAIMPIWKTHTLRWLYYRRTKNFAFQSFKHDKYTSNERCAKCKKGVGARFGWSEAHEDGTYTFTSYCPHCHEEYKGEPNPNLTHKI